jgi:hypothetical protein
MMIVRQKSFLSSRTHSRQIEDGETRSPRERIFFAEQARHVNQLFCVFRMSHKFGSFCVSVGFKFTEIHLSAIALSSETRDKRPETYESRHSTHLK